MLQVIRHAVTHPVDRLSEHQALIEMDDYLLVLGIDIAAFAELVKVAPDDRIAYLHEVVNEDVLAVGVEQMQCGFAV